MQKEGAGCGPVMVGALLFLAFLGLLSGGPILLAGAVAVGGLSAPILLVATAVVGLVLVLGNKGDG